MVHLITFINMATCHALVLWDCSLRALSKVTHSKSSYSMTFKLKTGKKKNNKTLIIKAEIINAY